MIETELFYLEVNFDRLYIYKYIGTKSFNEKKANQMNKLSQGVCLFNHLDSRVCLLGVVYPALGLYTLFMMTLSGH